MYGFLGPNGAGKTTTIRMLLGLMKPTSWKVSVFGQDMKYHRLSILKHIGSLVETPSYYGHLTAYENLECVRKVLEVPRSNIEEVLSLVRLSKDARKPVKNFSLGMKQRLGIATALLGNPKLLILDEPTNGLDPAGILEMRELIKSLPKEKDMSILISSHLLNEIDHVATQVGIIAKGDLLYQGSIGELRKQSRGKIKLKVGSAEMGVRVLLANGIKAEYDGLFVYLDDVSDEKVAHTIEVLVKNGMSIYRVHEENKSLEDLFLEMTAEEAS
ncbi:ABC-2 type transport system ATP-binding protein [Bacillus oleivorans]|uniref:ABC-2 type transport system ATP-binding protein n=1 Tax=Bacillus oleivorans TaxID=1448271 RepID=A0A285CHC2_9BACI|nr:ABC-2 type transport system ATP-binding protein [Bacillus oleivorans]